MFGRLLGSGAGHWSIVPVDDEAEVTRRYLDGTMVLETTVRTAGGVSRLTEAMPLDPDERGHDLGQGGAPGIVVLDLEGVEGEITSSHAVIGTTPEMTAFTRYDGAAPRNSSPPLAIRHQPSHPGRTRPDSYAITTS